MGALCVACVPVAAAASSWAPASSRPAGTTCSPQSTAAHTAVPSQPSNESGRCTTPGVDRHREWRMNPPDGPMGDTMATTGHRCAAFLLICAALAHAATHVPRFSVHELVFQGPSRTPSDRPAADIELYSEWEHEDGQTRYRIHGFWDGDGAGGTVGGVFKVRFCPTREGTWTLVNTHSNNTRLNDQLEGTQVLCTPSDNHGFWETEGLWFRRSDSTYQYVLGNVHYCLVSVDSRLHDIRANKDYYKKLRFMVQGFGLCEGPHPFFNSTGSGSSSGTDASRPNPAYFARIDEMIREGLRYDLIIDMYTDPQNHAIEQPGYLRYLAARFGSFPNVWLQISIEWNEKYSAGETADLGAELRSYLPYPT
ncbi:MAG: DUF5060 domain-containing protein, partial [Chitinivibrionales bacterium]|nr:DUF5060 domain-containing protein [Chitinivibrionales bacterium]